MRCGKPKGADMDVEQEQRFIIDRIGEETDLEGCSLCFASSCFSCISDHCIALKKLSDGDCVFYKDYEENHKDIWRCFYRLIRCQRFDLLMKYADTLAALGLMDHEIAMVEIERERLEKHRMDHLKQLSDQDWKDSLIIVYPNDDVDEADAQEITFIDGEDEISMTLWGNQTKSTDQKTASATLRISQGELLSIANVPARTQYKIVESAKPGYSLVDIEKRLDPDDLQEDEGSTSIDKEEGSIIGTIVPNHHNYITYTNRCLVADIRLQKVDNSGKGLKGAVFQLKTVSEDGYEEALATTIESISGVGDVTKDVGGETKVYHSSFESTGGIQTLSGLPDGIYRLYELYVPDGYISNYRYIQFRIKDRIMTEVITDTGDLSKVDTTANNIDLKIINTPGAALPNTGGPGTRLFMIFGSILVMGAVLLIWRRRRLI